MTFTNLSTGYYDSCLWEFDSGQKSDKCDGPSYTYKEDGQFTVSLTVNGPAGEDTKTVHNCVTVKTFRAYLPGLLRAN